MFGRWLSRLFWAKSRRPTDSELCVIGWLLPQHDRRTARLMVQAAEAPFVERRLSAQNAYEMVIPYVLDARNLVELEADTNSPVIQIQLAGAHTTARFSLELKRGGFLHKLVGETTDGTPWDIGWSMDSAQMRPAIPDDWLPTTLDGNERVLVIQRLATWLVLSVTELTRYSPEQLTLHPPCSVEDVSACEAREKMQLPLEYRELLRITNGIDIMCMQPYNILGTSETWSDEFEGRRGWVISDLAGYGLVVALPEGVECECFHATADGRFEFVAPLRKYITDSIKLLDGPPLRKK